MTEIYTIDHPLLRRKPEPVIEFTPELGDVLDDMAHTMLAVGGLGLAATQVGYPYAVAVVKMDDDKIIDLVNPQIWDGAEPTTMLEGCLSIPNYEDTLLRWNTIKGVAQNRNGVLMEFQCWGLAAQAVQHEVDHLEGILFVDRLIDSKRWRDWIDARSGR